MKCIYWMLLLNLKFICVIGILTCYKCTEKIKSDCYYGNPDEMKSFNCSKNSLCVSYKSETTQDSNSFITTFRGCETGDICEQIMKQNTKNRNVKFILCETCNTSLCNSNGSTITPAGIVFLFVLYFLLNTNYIYFGINYVHNQIVILYTLISTFLVVIASFVYSTTMKRNKKLLTINRELLFGNTEEFFFRGNKNE